MTPNWHLFWAERAPTVFRAPAEQQQNAPAGVLLIGRLTSLAGEPPIIFRAAQDIDIVMGGRTYWKKFELRGAAFFSRISDPGNAFPGTHPPNQKRIETVGGVVARL